MEKILYVSGNLKYELYLDGKFIFPDQNVIYLPIDKINKIFKKFFLKKYILSSISKNDDYFYYYGNIMKDTKSLHYIRMVIDNHQSLEIMRSIIWF